MKFFRRYLMASLLISLMAPQLPAKSKQRKTPPADQDQISVAGHIALAGGPIVRFMATNHYSRSYVYAERGPGQPITLLDVTVPSRPTVVSQLDANQLPVDVTQANNLVVVSGTAAISTSAPAESGQVPSQTIRLLDFSDPASPKVTKQFDGVSAVQRVSGTVTLLANPEGIWVLTNHLADDPGLDERYALKVLYGDVR